MPGQQNLLNFLNQPAPGKAALTQVIPPPAGKRASPRQQQAGAFAAGQQAQRLGLQQQKQAQAQQRINQAQQRVSQAQQRIDLRKQQEERLQTRQDVKFVSGAAESLRERFSGGAARLNTWAANVPTPGGIGILLFLIFLLLWAVVPVNGGKTRAQLFWLTIMGRTKMSSKPEGGGTFDPTQTNGTGMGGIQGNGHIPQTTPVSDLLNQLSIRDFGAF